MLSQMLHPIAHQLYISALVRRFLSRTHASKKFAISSPGSVTNKIFLRHRASSHAFTGAYAFFFLVSVSCPSPSRAAALPSRRLLY